MDRLFLLFHRIRPVLENTFVSSMCHWSHSGGWFTHDARKSSVNLKHFSSSNTDSYELLRWLIDTGKDTAGMQVIADLHGGDPTNEIALAEFQEIKDKVQEEVIMHAQ